MFILFNIEYLFYFQKCDDVNESMILVLYIFVSVTHQYLNNFFGEYIVEKVIG